MAEPGRALTRMSRSDRRAQLLDAARTIFVDQGYHAAAMDDIAEHAGVSKPVLYQHFSSKLELYRDLIIESSDEILALVKAAMDATDENQQRVHQTIKAYFTFVADNDQAYRLIFESDLRGEPEVQAAVDRTTDRCVDLVTEAITADTGFDTARGRLVASALVGLSQVAARHWLSQGAQIRADDAVELLTVLAWRGISGFPRLDAP